ncbi:hypothetical protein ABDD95_20810 [Mucilaginibacter sp. PAMB04274]|uniref:hypothetical protein n=1 Tax=Mucilaginibacter sp. PAMB04274 TaxID=3138568 RepID=UPI0031F65316
MVYILMILAAVLFVAHVVLLLASFSRTAFSRRRYFYSHLTLWLTGICVFVLAWQFRGQQISGFLDYFNTLGRLILILIFTAALSLAAHLIVKFAILPAWYKS